MDSTFFSSGIRWSDQAGTVSPEVGIDIHPRVELWCILPWEKMNRRSRRKPACFID